MLRYYKYGMRVVPLRNLEIKLKGNILYKTMIMFYVMRNIGKILILKLLM